MKRLQALAAAVIVTGLVGLGMLAIGVNAALNPNTVAASNAPGDSAPNVSAASPDAQAQVKQLQDLVAQYQDREKQYQAQLNQASTQLQQYQQLLELQRRGLIRINAAGSILGFVAGWGLIAHAGKPEPTPALPPIVAPAPSLNLAPLPPLGSAPSGLRPLPALPPMRSMPRLRLRTGGS